MELSPIKLALLVLFSFLYGGTLGVVNDVNRIVRVFFGVRYSKVSFERLYERLKIDVAKEEKVGKGHKLNNICLSILIVLQDILLMISFAVGVILLGYYFNDGRFRAFTVIAIVIGFVIYYFTVGKLVMIISEPIMLFVRTASLFILKVLSIPITYLVRLIISITKKISERVKKRIAKRRNIRYNKREAERLTLLSRRGFIDLLNQREYKNES